MYFFPVFLFVRWIGYKSKYYKISFRYTSVFKNIYNVIWLWSLPCFGAESEIIYIYLCISVSPAKTHSDGYRDHISVVFISTAPFDKTQLPIPPHSDNCKTEQYRKSADRGEVNLESDVNIMALGNLRQSTTLPSQCEQLPLNWMWHILYFNCWYHF